MQHHHVHLHYAYARAPQVGSFYAVFMVANEMEDPFGNEWNDMPMLA